MVTFTEEIINGKLPFFVQCLFQCNLEDKKYEQKSEVLCTFTPNESHAYLLNVEPSNLVFLKTCNTDFKYHNIYGSNC